MSVIKKDVNASFGLLPLQVHVRSAVESEKAVSLTNVCLGSEGNEHAPAKINSIYRCPLCSNEDKATLVKAKQQGKTEFVLVPQEEMDKVKAEAEQFQGAMQITTHAAADVEASTLETGSFYYLEPATAAYAEIYALVMHTIKTNPDTAFVTMWAARTAPAMYRLDVHNDVLVIRQMAWPSQVQPAPAVPTTFNPAYEAQAQMFVDSTRADFNPDTYKDARADLLDAFVASQNAIVGERPEVVTAAPQGLDIMALLQASTQAAKPVAAKRAAKKATKAPAKKAARKSA